MSRAREILLVHRSQGAAEESPCMDLLRYVRISPQVAPLLRRRMRARLLQLEREAATSERTLVVSAKNISLHSLLFWQRRDPPPPGRTACPVYRGAGRRISPSGSSSACGARRAGLPRAMRNPKRTIRGLISRFRPATEDDRQQWRTLWPPCVARSCSRRAKLCHPARLAKSAHFPSRAARWESAPDP